MQLVSYQFLLLLLPLSMFGRWVLPFRWAQTWLLLCSYLFAYTWGWASLGLLLLYTLGAWFFGQALVRWEKRKKTTLAIFVSLALLSLMACKAVGLFPGSQSTNSTLILAGGFIPLGISFYTFVLIAYLVEVYRGRKAESSIVALALHIAFFPKLIAGPIVRPSQLLEQFKAHDSHDCKKLSTGVDLLLAGLVKKMVIADGISSWVAIVFKNPQDHSSLGIWTAVIGFTIQIYYDFSGYTDIARGAANLLGFELPANFNLPYLASNPREFWHRWHITLSNFLRDYLYIPMGGNRKGASRTYFNLMATMVLGGMWHGMRLHFILWGAYHGLLLLLNMAWGSLLKSHENTDSWRTGWAWKTISWFLCFLSVSLAWILFRSPDATSAIKVFSGLFSITPFVSIPTPMHQALVILTVVALGHVLAKFVDLFSMLQNLPWWARGLSWAAGLGLVFLFGAAPGGFIYRMF